MKSYVSEKIIKKESEQSAKAKNIIVNFSTQYGRKSFSYPQRASWVECYKLWIKSLQIKNTLKSFEGKCDGTCARLKGIFSLTWIIIITYMWGMCMLITTIFLFWCTEAKSDMQFSSFVLKVFFSHTKKLIHLAHIFCTSPNTIHDLFLTHENTAKSYQLHSWFML